MTDDNKTTKAPAEMPESIITDLLKELPPHEEAAGDPGGDELTAAINALSDAERQELQEKMQETAAQINTQFNKIAGNFAKQRETLQAAANKLISVDLSGVFEAMSKIVDTKNWRELLEKYKPVFDLYDELQELQPYLHAELKKPKYEEAITVLRQELNDPDYNELAIEDLIDYEFSTVSGLMKALQEPPKDSLTFKAIRAARSAKKKADSNTQIQAYTARKLDLPTDKLNLFAWEDRKSVV